MYYILLTFPSLLLKLNVAVNRFINIILYQVYRLRNLRRFCLETMFHNGGVRKLHEVVGCGVRMVRAVMSDAWHALRSVNSSLCRVCSVSSGADACPLPFRSPFPLPASSYPRRNRETSKLHARKAESSYLLDSRVATAPPFARNRCEILPIVLRYRYNVL